MITKLYTNRDGLLNNKHTDIDVEITSLQPSLVNSEITSFKQHKLKFENDIKTQM